MFAAVIALFIVSSGFCSVDEFNLSSATVNSDDFVSGGPQKDGIPAISSPKFIAVSKADFLEDNDLVIGVVKNDISKAYPIKILNWHEIINDKVGEMPLAITWCPLTRSGIVFNRNLDGEKLSFGVSGLLYKSNLVMYDKSSNGLWPQLKLGSVSGRYSGNSLEKYPSLLTSWREWKKTHPDTLVLSQSTGHKRDYTRDPYAAYHRGPETMFPLKNVDMRLQEKDLVVGIKIKNTAKAYPISALKATVSIEDKIGGKNILVYRGPGDTGFVTDEKGNLLSAVTMYWFAWSSFNENTEIYQRGDI
jgi:hypothetical protein